MPSKIIQSNIINGIPDIIIAVDIKISLFFLNNLIIESMFSRNIVFNIIKRMPEVKSFLMRGSVFTSFSTIKAKA